MIIEIPIERMLPFLGADVSIALRGKQDLLELRVNSDLVIDPVDYDDDDEVIDVDRYSHFLEEMLCLAFGGLGYYPQALGVGMRILMKLPIILEQEICFFETIPNLKELGLMPDVSLAIHIDNSELSLYQSGNFLLSTSLLQSFTELEFDEFYQELTQNFTPWLQSIDKSCFVSIPEELQVDETRYRIAITGKRSGMSQIYTSRSGSRPRHPIRYGLPKFYSSTGFIPRYVSSKDGRSSVIISIPADDPEPPNCSDRPVKINDYYYDLVLPNEFQKYTQAGKTYQPKLVNKCAQQKTKFTWGAIYPELPIDLQETVCGLNQEELLYSVYQRNYCVKFPILCPPQSDLPLDLIQGVVEWDLLAALTLIAYAQCIITNTSDLRHFLQERFIPFVSTVRRLGKLPPLATVDGDGFEMPKVPQLAESEFEQYLSRSDTSELINYSLGSLLTVASHAHSEIDPIPGEKLSELEQAIAYAITQQPLFYGTD